MQVEDRPERVVTPSTQQNADFDVAAILNGDRRAFEELVRRESPRLYRMIVRIVRDPDEAQSVLQETFLQAFRRLDTFRGDAKLSTWLYGIGINQARAALRKTRRYQPLEEQDIDRLQPSVTGGMFDSRLRSWNPDRVTERAERAQLVRAAIDRLPENYRTIIILRDIEEFSTAETARMLDINEGAVRVRLHRARLALRALLDSHFGDGNG